MDNTWVALLLYCVCFIALALLRKEPAGNTCNDDDGVSCMQAISPHHGIAAFTGPGGFEAGWRLLAGIMLAITGAEAMYADLGHFNAPAVTVSH